MGECQSKAIGHTQESFKHIQAYLEPCVTLTYLKLWYIQNIFRTYSEHIQNQKHIQNPGIFPTLLYPEPRYSQNVDIIKIWGIFITLSYIYYAALIIFTAIIILTNYNYFRKACHVEINIYR